MKVCTECGCETAVAWNGGRCYDCHEAACAFSLGGDLAPDGFDPGYAGERWDDD